MNEITILILMNEITFYRILKIDWKRAICEAGCKVGENNSGSPKMRKLLILGSKFELCAGSF